MLVILGIGFTLNLISLLRQEAKFIYPLVIIELIMAVNEWSRWASTQSVSHLYWVGFWIVCASLQLILLKLKNDCVEEEEEEIPE